MAELPEPSKDEIRNGWTARRLANYRADRDKAVDLVPGLVVTEFKRPNPPQQIIGPSRYNPHKWT